MPDRFSSRLQWHAVENELSAAIARHQKSGRFLIDLSGSNPTQVGLDLPVELLAEFLSEAALSPYQPHPLGLRAAREAVAASLHTRTEVPPDDIVITASTSEAYSFLFKLLCDSGDNVLIGTPTYPLLDNLATLESIELRHFDLDSHGGWNIDFGSIAERRDERTRAIVIIHPNNPTGSYVSSEQLDQLLQLGLPIISDEVFFDFPLERGTEPRSAADAREGLVFSLGGLSKGAALPHWKLGWIRVAGDEQRKRHAITALELVADTYLSVATPVQAALPQILDVAPEIRLLIRDRLKRNLVALDAQLLETPAVTRLRVEGGWSVVLRIPRIANDEQFAIALLRDEAVLVHPGYFFDFKHDGYVVLSLLTNETEFADGVTRLTRHVAKAIAAASG